MEHKIFAASLEVDQDKISLSKTLIPLTTVKGIRSFLRHVGFYRKFIQDFSKIARPLCRLIEKDAKFEFDEACSSAFEEIKAKVVISQNMDTPNRAKNLKLCVMSVTMQWELFWDREQRRYLEPSIMPVRLSMKLKKITQQLRKKCWQWSLLVRSSSHTYWDLMSLYKQITQQSNS